MVRGEGGEEAPPEVVTKIAHDAKRAL